MVKLASTILAFPNHKLNFDLMSDLNSIEWTAQQLDEKKPNFTKIDTMLSIIDGKKIKGLINEKHVQEHLIKNIKEGTNYQIYNYVYGSPATRDFKECPSHDESIKIFMQIVKKLDKVIDYESQRQPIKFYIEPLPHDKGWLDSMHKVMTLVEDINYEINHSYQFNIGIQFLPLIDTGTLMQTNFNFIASEGLALCTDRIHLSQDDNTKEFKDLPSKVIRFVKDLCYYNKDLTISYEHININQNNSLKEFKSYFMRALTFKDSHFDVAVIGKGIYGSYIANQLAKKNLKVALISKEHLNDRNDYPQIASYINQARVHNGYHYPRSITTAKDSVKHYHHFKEDFKDCIIDDFDQIYGIPKYGSLTSAQQFKKFSDDLGVKCEPFNSDDIIHQNIQQSFLVDECAIDTQKMMQQMQDHLDLSITEFNMNVDLLKKLEHNWLICDLKGSTNQINANYVVNATYSNLNEIEKLAKQKLTSLKLETCEIALFKTKEPLKRAYTFMDGPFISIMPFKKDENMISMTSVTYTPHSSGREDLSNIKSNKNLMLQEASQFLKKEYLNQLKYQGSKYVIKAVPLMAESDDNRLIQINKGDHFVSVLSGKLNAIYECDELCNDISSLLKREKVKGMIF